MLDWIPFGDRKRRVEAVGRLVAEGAALLGRRDLEAARAKATEALMLEPTDTAALQLNGAVLCESGFVEAGVASFRSAVERNSKNARLRVDYGNALVLAGDMDAAEIEFRLGIQLAPENAPAYKALGTLLLNAQRLPEATTTLERALALVPGDLDTMRRVALAAFRSFDYFRACELYGRLRDGGALDSNDLNCFGMALLYTGDVAAARRLFEDALTASPADSPSKSIIERNLAYCHLTAGNWSDGFRLHERRHRASRAYAGERHNSEWLNALDAALKAIPPWTGGSCAGRRVLVWSEQGLGDTIMCMRLLSVLRNERGAAEAALLCPPSLAALGPCCEDVRFIPADGWQVPSGEFDLHCSVMSLPYLLGVTPDAVPGQMPCLVVPDSQRRPWQDRTVRLTGFKVGIVWSGNPKLALDALRSMPLDLLRPLFAVGGVSFVSLQKDDAAREELDASGIQIADWMDDCRDFMDTAALIDTLDLVISVDTAVAHLAGALGKPVWLLNRFESEWRWMRDREDSPWYPSMRIFSQTEPRKWSPVIARVASELRRLAPA